MYAIVLAVIIILQNAQFAKQSNALFVLTVWNLRIPLIISRFAENAIPKQKEKEITEP